MKKLLFFLFIILFVVSAYAEVANITFVWDANIEPDLVGYYLYKTQSAGIYTTPEAEIRIGETHILQIEDPNGIYYFVVTAFDESNNESDYSNEVSWEPPEIVIDTNAPTKPRNFRITVEVIVESN